MSEAFETDRQIKELRSRLENAVRLSTFELGRLLKSMRDDKLYLELGYEGFTSYLGDPEISFSQSSAYNAIQLYETYELKLNVPPPKLENIPVRRLTAISGLVTLESLDEWLAKAKSLSESDFRTEIVEVKESKDHPVYIPAPKLFRCQKCGKWKVNADPDTLCTC
jgi:hypothetical protein